MIPTPLADFQAAADTLRDAALAASTDTVPMPVSVVHAFANWLDDAGNDAEQLGAPDPMALIAALQVLYPSLPLASGALEADQ
ncbi:hypothetical protein ACFXD5_12100 [Streptomyces sp. NPDC059385]|uniref:hypothetical protein n=1 Tax=Streptomyces sp. NPDC059385 TaxID=3346817 RepID=UPI0036886CD6